MKEDVLKMETYSLVKINAFETNSNAVYLLLFITACSATVIPAVPSTNLTAIADFDSATMSNVTSLQEAPGITTKFKFNITDQPVNSSFCHIASLEVYRGRKQAIQISHYGFSLSINGNVNVRE